MLSRSQNELRLRDKVNFFYAPYAPEFVGASKIRIRDTNLSKDYMKFSDDK